MADKLRLCLLSLLTCMACLVTTTSSSAFAPQAPPTGVWHAWLDTAGGDLPFELIFETKGDEIRTVIRNGAELIDVPATTLRGEELSIDIDYFASKIVAKMSSDGSRMEGEWWKNLGIERISTMAFHATKGARPRFSLPATSEPSHLGKLAGRWRVQFQRDPDPSVGIFSVHDGEFAGTFLTTLGDYRYLAGVADDKQLKLSCFDGAHAFLFSASVTESGILEGNFWSSKGNAVTWTAQRDDTAKLPDSWELTKGDTTQLRGLEFPDLSGELRSLADPAFAGKARLVVVFGSWCPNCKDETAYLVELDRRYRDRGLSIVGLAFERTGDFGVDSAQLRTYVKRQGIEYPILVAGISNKRRASEALPILDQVRSYPTTLFINSDGRLRAVHQGFAGPGTGKEHQRLRTEFERVIEELLTEKGS